MKRLDFFNWLSGWIKPGTNAAYAMICGFWISQMLALYFVSGAVCGMDSKASGALFLGVFGVFLVLHSFRPWSKLAVVFGTCSVAVLARFFLYLHGTGYNPQAPSAREIIILAGGFAIAGVMLDAEKYRQWLINTQRQPLKLGVHSVKKVQLEEPVIFF